MKWHGIEHFIGNVAKEVNTTKIALGAYAYMIAAPKIETDAKANASWHDISGNARRGLNAGVVMRGDHIVIYLAHTVDYGPYLELAHDRKYAIIDPTLEKFTPEVKRNYERIMGSPGGAV